MEEVVPGGDNREMALVELAPVVQDALATGVVDIQRVVLGVKVVCWQKTRGQGDGNYCSYRASGLD
jgi:hypothetical protein